MAKMAVIITDELHKSHNAPILSIIGLVSLSVIVVTLALPLLMVIMTHSKFFILTQN